MKLNEKKNDSKSGNISDEDDENIFNQHPYKYNLYIYMKIKIRIKKCILTIKNMDLYMI